MTNDSGTTGIVVGPGRPRLDPTTKAVKISVSLEPGLHDILTGKAKMLGQPLSAILAKLAKLGLRVNGVPEKLRERLAAVAQEEGLEPQAILDRWAILGEEVERLRKGPGSYDEEDPRP